MRQDVYDAGASSPWDLRRSYRRPKNLRPRSQRIHKYYATNKHKYLKLLGVDAGSIPAASTNTVARSSKIKR